MSDDELFELYGLTGYPKHIDGLRAVERAARAAEREACARLCDEQTKSEIATGKVDHNEIPWTLWCAMAIRARADEGKV